MVCFSAHQNNFMGNAKHIKNQYCSLNVEFYGQYTYLRILHTIKKMLLKGLDVIHQQIDNINIKKHMRKKKK